MGIRILRFKDWQIKSRLLFLSFVGVVSTIILGAIAYNSFNTSKTLGILINAERIHNNTFQEGMEDYYVSVINQDSAIHEIALEKIKAANQMAKIVADLEKLTALKDQQTLADTLYNAYEEAYSYDRRNAVLMARKMKMFVASGNEKILATRDIAREVMLLGQEIEREIQEHHVHQISPQILSQMESMRQYYKDFAKAVNDVTIFVNRILISVLILLVIVLGSITAGISALISRSITRTVKDMVNSFKMIAKGDLSAKLNINSKNEFGQLSDSFNEIQKGLIEAVDYTKKVAAGDFSVEITPKSSEDELSISLNKMADDLEAASNKHNENFWLRSGLNELNEELRGDIPTKEVASLSINFLVKQVKAELGAIYYFDEEYEVLRLGASYGVLQDQIIEDIKPGDGIVGQVAIDKQILHLKNIPANYYKAQSSVGEALPSELIIIPLLFDNDVWGILELSTLGSFDELHLKFLEEANETLAVNLASSIARVRMQTLLEKTQDQASELQVQQEELRVANEELEEQTKVLTESEKRLQVQQEELRVANEELEERTNQLEIQKDEIEQKNSALTLAKEDLERKARELHQSSQYKSEFLANMSHELRTPLNSLLILSGMLAKNKKGNLSDDQVESMEIIHKSGTDLLQLINEILDLSKIEAGKMNIHFEDITPDEIEREIVMNFSPVANEKNLKLRVVKNGFPPHIQTDRMRVLQVLKNLLSNAFKFTEKGSVSILFGRPAHDIKFTRPGLTLENTCCISVRDTGVGIPKEKKEAIFEAFQQADGSISRKYGGTGLGLSISREIMSLLGGEIMLQSEENQGSIFSIYLPLQEAIPVEVSNQDEKILTDSFENVETQQNETDAPISPEVPFFIEDDRDADNGKPLMLILHHEETGAKNLLASLNRLNFNAVVASTIDDSIVLIEHFRPIGVILSAELALASENGVLSKLKEHKLAEELPIHIINPLEGIHEKDVDKLRTIGAENFEKAIEKIKNQLLSDHKRILIVEDDVTTRKILRDLLESVEADIEEAETGSEAIVLIKSRRYDCVILDLGLPDFGGKEILQKLAEQNIKIPNTIIYTGKELSREEHRELNKYTNSIILKGLKSDERLMDEVTLFLHQVASHIQEKPKPELELDDSVFKGKKVLVVDDEIRNVFALGKILEEREIEVLEAENGKVALEVLEQEKEIDLVLMDVMMPEMDGYEAMSHIRKNPEIKDIPIICLTAKAMKEDHEKAINNGANDYLSKPVDEEKLFSMLKIWLYN
ncbi:response regulator [Puteibacter caeruleilacunae]|nr:response regulator [Puteibacter caeruleilacunae]